MSKDYYKILGVSRNTSEEDIKRAYRKLAHKYHPDKAGGDEEKFKEVNEAYQVLSSKEKRAQYDKFGSVFEGGMPGGGAGGQWQGGFGFDPSDFERWGTGFGAAGDFSDIFETIFEQFGGGGRRRQRYAHGSDIEIQEEITLEEAFGGAKKKLRFKTYVSCEPCGSLGHNKSKGYSTCSVCRGKGEIRVDRRTFFGNFSQVKICETCFGSGEIPKEICNKCKGVGRISGERNVEIHIAQGVEDGQIIKVKGMGEIGERGSGAGDLYVVVRIKPHARFERKKSDLFIKKEIKITDALLGREIYLEDVNGEKFSFAISSEFDFSDKLKVPGRGMPRFSSYGRGDLYITFSLKAPKHISKKTKELLELLGDEF